MSSVSFARKNTLLFIFIIVGTLLVLPTLKVSALSGSQFQAGRIIDDSVFFNYTSMGPTVIQDFLNSKVPTCDTNGTQAIFDSANGDTVTRAVYSQRRGYNAPFTCLKDFSQDVPAKTAETSLCNGITAGTKTSAQIIYEVSISCGISPKVMLVLLQKEQSLVTDDWPWPTQYRSATGYGCPDTAPCDTEYYGFFNQVYSAARQFKRYARDANLFNYKANATSYVLYNPNAACGGTNLLIQNQATADLYNYTPYQPNTAALNNLYGTGDSCSAYGNRNFWRLFNDWFGNPIGPEYAWNIDNFSYSGGDNTVGIGQTETLTLKARNIGRQPWYNHGDHPVRLGTWLPGRVSPLASNSWVANYRPANLTESVVNPGEVGTFTFQVTPGTIGSYVEGLNLVVENYTWMDWTGFSPTINVVNPYSWSIDSVNYQNGTGLMEPGSQQLITVVAKNIGSATWNKSGGSPIMLGTWQPGRQSAVSKTWLSPTRAVGMNENTVAPGQTAGFQFYVSMPSSGSFYERLNLVAEGQTWLNDPGLTLYLEGRSFAWQPVWQSLSTGNPNIGRNETFDITVRAKNTGTMTWTKGGSFPVRLATVSPEDRGSGLFYKSWIRDTRPAALIENSVAPGQEGTFTFTAHTPSTPGIRVERFSLVAEGILWFNDPGFNIQINVQ